MALLRSLSRLPAVQGGGKNPAQCVCDLPLRSSLIAVAVTAGKATAPVLLALRRSVLHGIEGLGRTRDHPRAAEIARVQPEPRLDVRIIDAIIAAGVEALRRAA